jgi:antitoxin MazE
MRGQIQKWGNSLAVRIPKAFAAQAQLVPDTVVEISLEDNKIVIAPLVEPELTLDELLDGITDENIHGEVDSGAAVGKEIFW